jgi:hypothetical protein
LPTAHAGQGHRNLSIAPYDPLSPARTRSSLAKSAVSSTVLSARNLLAHVAYDMIGLGPPSRSYTVLLDSTMRVGAEAKQESEKPGAVQRL